MLRASTLLKIGQLPAARDENDRESRRRRRGKPPNIEEAIRSLVMAIAFFVISVLVSKYAPAGQIWWFWMLIPAFTFLAKGISEIVRLKHYQESLPQSETPRQFASPPPMEQLPPRNTEELRPPVPSVTESTTRHLGAEAPTRQFDPWDNQKSS